MRTKRSFISLLRAVCTVAVVLVAAAQAPLQASDAQGLMDALKVRLQGAKTYTASMRLKVDLEFVNVPESNATIYFKAPNKTHIDAPGFAMIPKQGADLSAAQLLAAPYTAVDIGMEAFHGTMMRKIKVIPIDDSSRIAVATIYVDTTLMVPRKVITTSKQGGTYVAELVYDNKEALRYCLPSYVKLLFDVGKFELPRTMTGDFDSKKEKKSAAPPGKAVVEIWYSGYKINIPIADSTFE